MFFAIDDRAHPLLAGIQAVQLFLKPCPSQTVSDNHYLRGGHGHPLGIWTGSLISCERW
ncbi:Uncharacterised protein [Mycobacteroides abscessus subsp. abscessus]|nr:Uncharacterised protein [Mycobacteroides abscessus subsp. abscessus]SIN05092.1 Uncharacterised protein [Mycobacteroides abscessus subsp. abscessus]SKH74711.1 Uncharacterised protein [Mycobacteroides abscessus subsp. abscessus]